MTMDGELSERERVRMEAALEGEAAVVRSIGGHVKVSEMELVVLVNLARLTCLAELAAGPLDPDLAAEAAEMRDECRRTLQRYFHKGSPDNGLQRLMQSCQAMLGSERLGQYVVDAGAEAPND